MGVGSLAGQLGTDAWTKDCETHPKQYNRNMKIDTLLCSFRKYQFSLCSHSSFRLLKLSATVKQWSPVCILPLITVILPESWKPSLFPLKYNFFLTPKDDSAAHCPAWSLFKHRYQADQQASPPPWTLYILSSFFLLMSVELIFFIHHNNNQWLNEYGIGWWFEDFVLFNNIPIVPGQWKGDRIVTVLCHEATFSYGKDLTYHGICKEAVYLSMSFYNHFVLCFQDTWQYLSSTSVL